MREALVEWVRTKDWSEKGGVSSNYAAHFAFPSDLAGSCVLSRPRGG
jgi:hypothetical protein